MKTERRWLFPWLVGLVLPVGWALAGAVPVGRIANDPYAAVDWQSDARLKTQFHDHVSMQGERILSYDRAEYDVVSFMHYSGVPRIEHAWKERRWPPEDWLPQDLLESLQSIRFFIPNGEEAGTQHILSPFLESYIEYRDPSSSTEKLPYQYGTGNEAIRLIDALGGLAILAHPINCCAHLSGYHAVEIYNAHPSYEFWTGAQPVDQNSNMLAFWDARLADNPKLYGVAVNDWYGPWAAEYAYAISPPAWLVDSGKTIVLAHEATPVSFREAVERGAMLAVKDIGPIKDHYPQIHSIAVEGDVIAIDTTDDVAWLTGGQVVGYGTWFDTATLDLSTGYLRAEITNDEGSTVYTQPWAIQPPPDPPFLSAGDADQDLDFDQFDLVRVIQAGRYRTELPATWGEGDWDATSPARRGSPSAGDGSFNQWDLVVAQQAATYLTGPYTALASPPETSDVDVRVVYNAKTGAVRLEPPEGIGLTSFGLDSRSGVFTGLAARNLEGVFDIHSPHTLFKIAFGSAFGSTDLGLVAEPGLAEAVLQSDLNVYGSVRGGGGLAALQLVYVPEGGTATLALIGMLALGAGGGHRRLGQTGRGHRIKPRPCDPLRARIGDPGG